MTEENLPKIEFPKLKAPKEKKAFLVFVLVIFLAIFSGFATGTISGDYFYSRLQNYLEKLNIKIPELSQTEESEQEKEIVYLPQTSQEEAVINAVKEASPAVVSIIVTKNLPVLEEYYISPFEEFGAPFFEFQIPQFRQKGVEKKEIGGGTGFFITKEGMLLTNVHVVADQEAEYTILTNDGKKYPAKVLDRDSVRDLALLEVQEKPIDKDFPTIKLGDSDKVQIGQTVITIGNALGEFRNTVSVGVISGLGRTITASGGGTVNTVEDVIQTDAAINQGNSGGPLLNLKGEVIGVNFAMVQEAQNIGFAIPINKAKKALEQIKSLGKIVYPFLGVRYILINESIQKEKNLPVGYGALIAKGPQGEAAISLGSPAEKAGLKENDIILEFNGEKINTENSLTKSISKYNPGDKITLKVLRDGKENTFEATLSEKEE